ncbi:uncharacterized protein LOC104583072 [Brachypodium distachyon]|uniref:uncharacterized protein LOC104583072 n=1 Tax=Brachypodium distachyon TaxID=15368 RepID=UPI000530022A|nr:uncharacterized protein LOC104583072 [Brachypodium distachyon]|eukprot:XP_010233078.1 uncharacterized protein LOC104583072 [Brachypodium distachyon]
MSPKLSLKIAEYLKEYDDYFKLKRDAVGTLGFSTTQKYMVSLRLLAYGIHADTQDDYLRMAESMAIDCMYSYRNEVMAVFRDIYLRTPTPKDTIRILAHNAERGFPGSYNDINVLQCSNLFAKLVEGTARLVNCEINGARFSIVRYTALTWSKDQMWKVMAACVIIHNKIIKSDRECLVYDTDPYKRMGPLADVYHHVPAAFAAFLVWR